MTPKIEAQTKELTVLVSKVISAPVEKVFEAWTEPAILSKWFGCNKVTSLNVENDLRVGGKYQMEANACEAGGPKLVSGEYKEIVANKKLVFTWTNSSEEFPAKDTLVTIEFHDKGGKTEVVIKHTNFAVEATRQAHNMGWTESLEKLEGHFTAA